MAGPCLENLSLIRIVNVCFVPIGYTPPTKAFFSLHYGNMNNGNTATISKQENTVSYDNLLYVSETIEAGSTMNFGVVSLPTIPQQSFQVRVKIWLSPHGNNSGFKLFYDISLDTRNLTLLERAIYENSGDSILSANAIIWQFDGHEYCLRSHLLEKYDYSLKQINPPNRREKRKKTSYTVDDARQIASLVIGLRDFDKIKATTSEEIDTILSKSTLIADEQERLVHSLNKLKKMISRQESANETLESLIFASRNSVRNTEQIVETDFPSLKRLIEEKQEILSSQVSPLRESLGKSVYPHIISATNRLVSVMIDAFPIELADNASGHFCISGIEFPSSIKEILSVCYNETPKLNPTTPPVLLGELAQEYFLLVDCVNAGLSEIVAALNLLSSIMGVPMKYEMTNAGSRSHLVEYLSPQQVVSNNRNTPLAMHVSTKVTYPLFYDVEQAEKNLDGLVIADGQKHPRDVRFERGLALLNRNLSFFISEIATLYSEYKSNQKSGGSIANNIPLDCLDHFLWNLHYIMLFVTAPSE